MSSRKRKKVITVSEAEQKIVSVRKQIKMALLTSVTSANAVEALHIVFMQSELEAAHWQVLMEMTYRYDVEARAFIDTEAEERFQHDPMLFKAIVRYLCADQAVSIIRANLGAKSSWKEDGEGGKTITLQRSDALPIYRKSVRDVIKNTEALVESVCFSVAQEALKHHDRPDWREQTLNVLTGWVASQISLSGEKRLTRILERETKHTPQAAFMENLPGAVASRVSSLHSSKDFASLPDKIAWQLEKELGNEADARSRLGQRQQSPDIDNTAEPQQVKAAEPQQVELNDVTIADQINPFEEVEAKEFARYLIERACQKLTAEEARVLQLSYEGLTETEISERTGKLIGSVRKWKGRLKIKINKIMSLEDYL